MRCTLLVILFALPLTGPQAQERQGGAWQVTERPSVTLELDALNVVRAGAVAFRPALYLRCLDEKLEAFVATGAVGARHADYRSAVRLRWADRPPLDETWSRSTDYSVVFAPDPAAFLQQLLATPEMTFELRPEGADPITARFNGSGLDAHLPQLRTKCRVARAAAVHGGAGRVYAESEVDEKPSVRSLPDAEYPAMLRRAGVRGTVVVEVVLDTLGRLEPGSPRVISSPHPAFNDPAVNAVERGVFQQARLHGQGVRVRTRVSVAFANTQE